LSENYVTLIFIGKTSGKAKCIDIKNSPVKIVNFELSHKHQDVDLIENYNFLFTGFTEKWNYQQKFMLSL